MKLPLGAVYLPCWLLSLRPQPQPLKRPAKKSRSNFDGEAKNGAASLPGLIP